jgi:hypothetical protein
MAQFAMQKCNCAIVFNKRKISSFKMALGKTFAYGMFNE